MMAWMKALDKNVFGMNHHDEIEPKILQRTKYASYNITTICYFNLDLK